MIVTDHRAAALAAYPELQRLLDLDAAGWTWMPPPLDESGHPIEIHGFRSWGRTGQVDGLRVRSLTDAAAVRTDWEGGVLWRQDGGLVDVVERLLELPPPGSPFAPRLVRGLTPAERRWMP